MYHSKQFKGRDFDDDDMDNQLLKNAENSAPMLTLGTTKQRPSPRIVAEDMDRNQMSMSSKNKNMIQTDFGSSGSPFKMQLNPTPQFSGNDNFSSYSNQAHNKVPTMVDTRHNVGGYADHADIGNRYNNQQQQQQYGAPNNLSPKMSSFGTNSNQYNRMPTQPVQEPTYNQIHNRMSPRNQYNNTNPVQMSTPHSNMGGAYQGNVEIILSQMAKRITEQQQIRQIVDFFLPFDAYEGRTFEAWELEVMFQGEIQQGEAQTLVQHYSKQNQMQSYQPQNPSVPIQALINALSSLLRHLGSGSMYQSGSLFSQKQYQLSMNVKNYLSQITNYFQQMKLSSKEGYDRFFRQPYVNENDFHNFLQQIGINLQQYDNDAKELFNYFKVQNEFMLSPIGFVQGLKALQSGGTSGGMGMGNAGQNRMSAQENILDRVVREFQVILQRNNMSFEAALMQFRLPNTQYYDSNQIVSLCQNLGITLDPNQKRELIQGLDQDRTGKAKLSYLRQKVEGAGGPSNSLNMHQNSPHQQNQYGQQNPMNSHQQKGNIQVSINKIKTWMKQCGINDLQRFFQTSYLNNKVVVELQQFLTFLESPEINLNQKDSFELAGKFILDNNMGKTTTYYIDLELFDADLSDGPTLGMELHNSFISLNQVYDELRKYAMMTNGNIYQFFAQFDLNKDNQISKSELSNLLNKLGFNNPSQSDINNIFNFFDENKDGRVSVQELCNKFADLSSVKAIKDPSHWAFFIFDSIRRISIANSTSLSQIFGINQFQIQTLKDQIFITKDQFFETLRRYQIPFNIQYEQPLLELLGADMRNNYQINFVNLQGLVGMNNVSTTMGQFNQERIKNPYELQFMAKYKIFYQSLYEAMQTRNIQTNYLGMLFKSADHQSQGLISLDDFKMKITSIDFERKIDMRNLAEITKKFLKQSGNTQLIDYRYFLGHLEVEVEKYKLINYMFGVLDQAIKQAGSQNLAQLFLKLDKTGQTNFTKQILQQTLSLIGLYLKPEELELILLEYDSKGQNHGQSLDFTAFNSDFEQFRSGKQQPNQILNKRNESYNQFFSMTKEYNIDVKNIQYNSNSIMEDYMSPTKRRQDFKDMKGPNKYGGGNNDAHHQKEPSIATMRAWSQIGIALESSQKLSIIELLHENDLQKCGQISPNNFKQILQHLFNISRQDQDELVTHYTTLSQKSIIIYHFLEDISKNVQDLRINTSLAVAIQDFKNLYSSINLGGIVQEQSLNRFQLQFEEIYKSIVGRGSDTYKYFESLSHSKQSVSKQEFSAGLLNLNLKSATANDINEIYLSLDQMHKGFIDIFTIDQAIRQTVTKSGIELSNHILEQILQAYNGDDAFIFQKLNDMDRMRRGKISELDFVTYFMKNAPQYADFSENDLHFLAQQYMNQKISKTDVDYNSFHTDLTRIKGQLGIHGNPSYHGINDMKEGNQNWNKAHDNQGRYNQNYNTQGTNNNPLSPSYSKNNTRTISNRAARPPVGFRVNIDPRFIDDLMKGTYMKGKLVDEYFQSFTIPGQQMINEGNFGKAIMSLGLDWTLNQSSTVFHEIDRGFNHHQTKMAISPEQVDQTVHFSTQKTIDDLHNGILQQIAQHTSQTGMNIRGEIQYYDYNKSMMMRVEDLKDLILNKMLIKDLYQQDIVFISMRYIQSTQNMIHYEKLLEDLDGIFRAKYSHNADFKSICDYIRKALISKQHHSLEEYLKKFMKQSRDQINFQEFEQAMSQLGIISEVCSIQQLDTLFKEIDISHVGKVTLPQIVNYLNKIATGRQTKEYQEEIIGNLVTTVRSRNILIDNIFKHEDPQLRATVPYDVFEKKMASQFQMKQIDARLIALKYLDNKQNIVNYRSFLLDYHLIEKNSAIGQIQHFDDKMQMNVPDQKMKTLLLRIGDQTLQKNIQLSREFQQYEKGNASINLQQPIFFNAFKTLGILLSTTDTQALTQFYGTTRDNLINHRKFLEDLKIYGTNRKPIETLTIDQRNLYKALGDYLKKHNLQMTLVQGLLSKDVRSKGYIFRDQIEDVFSEEKLTVSKTQFETMFGTLDKNATQEFNYKQMIEYLIGVDEANKLYTQAVGQKNKTVPSAGEEILYKFVMPAKPINPMNSVLGEIGSKVIHSNINIEEEFKKRIGNYQQTSMQIIKVSETDIIQVLKNCHVNLDQDEVVQLQAYFIHHKDGQNQKGEGLIYLIQFLTAVGLPPQTIGLAQALPKKILSQSELTMAKNVMVGLRNELAKTNKKPQDIFDKYKKQVKQASLKAQQFKMAILGECGNFGKQVTDEQINLLTYYLQEEVQGEISYNKMYLAFYSTDKEPPLKQYGTENIKKYEENIKKQLTQGLVPLEIIDLIHFMKSSNHTISSLFRSNKGQLSKQDFEKILRDQGFVHKNMPVLMDHLSLQGSKTSISLDKLSQFTTKVNPSGRAEGSQITSQMARDLYTKFDPKVRAQLQKMSDFFKKEGVTLQKLYQEMDLNQDGTVDKKEFVTKISTLSIPGVFPSDLGLIYDSIDINNDGYLSINEFGLFLEGAKASRMQRLHDLDHKQVNDMIKEIETLFKSFDDNGDGYVTGEEIYKSLLALGQKVTLQDAKDLIQTVDKNGDGKLELKEFTEIMLPKMKEDLMKQEDNVEELRNMFLEADIDHSGTLSIDELYSAILKMGAEVSLEELIEMMNEIDVDRNGALDIDEFVAMMNMGEEIQFRSTGAKNTYLNIKKVRKLNPMDFFNLFKNMPMNFIPSFYQEAWVKMRKNLPASVFMPQLDPKTMLYKDLMPLLSENIPPTQAQKAFQPRLRPIKMQIGCQILLELAEGIPIPKSGQGFERNQIVKRAVRVGLFDSARKEFVINAVQVNAIYNQNDEDIWKFNEWKENGMNPVLFKTDNKDLYCKGTLFLIFELVIYVQFDKKITEMSCGWCQLNTNLLDRQMTHKLPIKGGSPTSEMVIKGEDVHTKRTGINYIMKVVGTKISSQLQVSIRPQTKFTEETKAHLDLLPSTCLIQKRLLYFVSGFRNYVGEKLLKESSMGTFKHPEGDVIISTFPKIFNNPDICESLIKIWAEDFWSNVKGKQKLNIEFIMAKTKEYIQRLYPVLYSDEFQYHESNPVESAAGNQYLVRKREELIQAALRYGQSGLKNKVNQPVEALTTFKPFTVRELEFEIWDTQKAKQEQFLKQYDEIGLLTHSKSTMDQMNMGTGSNFNQRQLGGQQMQNQYQNPQLQQPQYQQNQQYQNPLQMQQQPQYTQSQQRPTDLLSALNQEKW